MSTQNSDAGSRSQTFASCETPKPPLGKFIIVDQANRARDLQSTRCSSAITSLALMAFLAGAPGLAVAQNIQADGSAAARAGAITHAQKMRWLFPDISPETQAPPSVIPQFKIDPDPSGAIATFQPNGPTLTAKNAFFQDPEPMDAPASPVISRRTAGRSVHSTHWSGFMRTRTSRCSA
jgi:hypothetical protein